MKRSFLLLLALWAFLLLPAAGIAEGPLTPTNIPESTLQQKLMDLGYLEQASHQTVSSSALEQAVLAFQNDQEIIEADGLDTRTLVRLFSLTDPSEASVWVPVYGGQRYHCEDSCSNMNQPEPVSLSTALELGYTPCKRCKP